MLQDTEYRVGRYIKWYLRTSDFRTVMKRRTLEQTRKVALLRLGLWLIWGVVVVCAAICVYSDIITGQYVGCFVALLLIAALPFLLAFGIVVPLSVGRVLIQIPCEKKIISRASKIFGAHKGIHIAIVGSFGKTTAKEILATVLSEGLNVAATPGNMNTPIGISRFALRLTGDEDVLITELGEERRGDVAALSVLTRPTLAIMTGVNEAHLVSFKSLEETTKTIFEIVDYMGEDATIYKNHENKIIAERTHAGDAHLYSRHGVDGWKVSGAKTSLDGTRFIAKKGDKIIHAHTCLIGLHTVGVTVAAIAIADSLGLSAQQIENGLKKVEAFEHRMQPRQLYGAWIIDDTYNGNSDGVKAGLEFLKQTDATRHIYVTPGLVEQGDKTEEVHKLIGTLAAKSADVVVLMKNSVTNFIVAGLAVAHFKGELTIIDDPLEFYTNLDQFVAVGDVVLMQNDWTDNYA